jgi:hypothetical protein
MQIAFSKHINRKRFPWQDQCELKRTNQKTVKGPPHPFEGGNPKGALVVAGKATK